MSKSWVINENAQLGQRNSLRVAASCRYLLELRDPTELPEALADPRWENLPLMVLGAGSNILFSQDFDGLVIHLAANRITSLKETAAGAIINVEAGCNWHEFVLWTLQYGHTGLENLSLIPGTVGAAPIQNIGAYGVELDRFVHGVEVYDRQTKDYVLLSPEQCKFTYRSSIFKLPENLSRYIITSVNFILPRSGDLVVDYPGVREQLQAMGCSHPTAIEVSQAICAIRQRKLPDPKHIGNAGSFFKNPIIDAAIAEKLKTSFPTIPVYPVGDDQAKLSAAWLLEQAGFKGKREGDAGFSEQHALVLVNHAQATGKQLWVMAQQAQKSVLEKFAIDLEAEPRIV